MSIETDLFMETNTIHSVMIHSLTDLRPHGINVLTGESCAFSRRLLCDVTKAGRDLILKALGIPDVSLSSPWNGPWDNEPVVGSILLDRETLQTICILALFEMPGTVEVWQEPDGTFHGLDIVRLAQWEESDWRLTDGWRKYRTFGSMGRNVHQMSGRTS